MLAGSCAGGSVADRRSAEAEEAAAAGDWEQAFTGYLEVLELDPDHAAASSGAWRSADRLVELGHGLTIETEAILVEWLAGEQRWPDVTTVLDRSMVAIPGGWGLMGTVAGRSDQNPQRSVYLDAYRIDRYEVTNLQYAAFVAARGEPRPVYWSDHIPAGTEIHPVVGVSWRQASSYCQWAGKRLPTEAEWERACRGENGQKYPWGDMWDPEKVNVSLAPLEDPDDAWVWLSDPTTAPATLGTVLSTASGASAHGICGLSGNASEWVADWYDPDAYSHLPDMNPIGHGPPWSHVVRGGAWLFVHDDEQLLKESSTCSFRSSSHGADDPRVGFRCASSGHAAPATDLSGAGPRLARLSQTPWAPLKHLHSKVVPILRRPPVATPGSREEVVP